MALDLTKIFRLDGELDKKSVSALAKALRANPIKEFDYLKFMQSVQTLKEMDMDDATSIKSAFATASTMGLSKEKLIRTANHYLKVLSKEREHFAVALKNQRTERVSSKLNEVELMKKEIQTHKKKIDQLNKEILAYQKKVDGADKVIAGEKAKIETIKNNFVQTHDHFENVIQNDLNLINKYL